MLTSNPQISDFQALSANATLFLLEALHGTKTVLAVLIKILKSDISLLLYLAEVPKFSSTANATTLPISAHASRLIILQPQALLMQISAY